MMIIIARILKENKYINKFIRLISPFFMRIFGFEVEDEVFIFLFSFLSGNPTSHILINDLYKEERISKAEANRLSVSLCFSSFLYLYKSSILFFKESIWIIILISYLIPLIFLIKPQRNYSSTKHISPSNKRLDLSQIINDSFNSLIRIFSFVFFFDIIASLLIQFFKLDNSYSFILSSLLDMTVSNRFYYSYSKSLDLFLYSFFNAFLGFSIHLQIINATGFLDYKEFLLKRLIIALISGLTATLLYYNIIIGLICFILLIGLIIIKKETTAKVISKC